MEPKIVIDAHTRHTTRVLFSPDNTVLLSAGQDNLIHAWTVQEWTQQHTFFGHTNSVNAIALTPAMDFLITGSTDNTVKVWNYHSGDVEYTLSGHKKTVATVAVSPSGEFIASGSYDGEVKIWNLNTGAELLTLPQIGRNVGSVDFSPDGNYLVGGGLGNDIYLWAFPSGELIKQIHGHETAVNSVRFSPNGEFLGSLGYEQTLIIRNTKNWEQVHSLKLESRGMDLTFTADSKKVVAAIDYGVRMWNLRTGEIDKQFELPVKGVYAVDVSPTRRWLAVGSADGKVRIWEIRGTRQKSE
ncbi:MAG: WD40 repeat domain-containing protein [Promethearchaeota archaeon]